MTHYHVSSNTGRYLKDDEIYCLDTVRQAAYALLRDARALVGLLAEGCDRDGCGYCVWCSAGKKARSLILPGAEPAARIETALMGASAIVIDSPVGPDLLVWMEQVGGTRATCHY